MAEAEEKEPIIMLESRLIKSRILDIKGTENGYTVIFEDFRMSSQSKRRAFSACHAAMPKAMLSICDYRPNCMDVSPALPTRRNHLPRAPLIRLARTTLC